MAQQDLLRLLEKILPQAGGEDVVRWRTGKVEAVNADGTLDVSISGLTIPDLPRFQSVDAAVDDVVNLVSYRGQLIVVGIIAGSALAGQTSRGVIAWGQRTTASSTTTAADAGVLRLDSVPLLLGRMYRVWTSPLHMDVATPNDEVRCRIRYNTAGTATTASTIMPGTTVHARIVDTNVSDDKLVNTVYVPAANETMSLLLCVGRIAGGGAVGINNSDTGDDTIMAVEDIGPAKAETGVDV